MYVLSCIKSVLMIKKMYQFTHYLEILKINHFQVMIIVNYYSQL